jgi:hypothetical protein
LHADGSSFSNTSLSIQSRSTLTLLAMPPWVRASISDLLDEHLRAKGYLASEGEGTKPKRAGTK